MLKDDGKGETRIASTNPVAIHWLPSSTTGISWKVAVWRRNDVKAAVLKNISKRRNHDNQVHDCAEGTNSLLKQHVKRPHPGVVRGGYFSLSVNYEELFPRRGAGTSTISKIQVRALQPLPSPQATALHIEATACGSSCAALTISCRVMALAQERAVQRITPKSCPA